MHDQSDIRTLRLPDVFVGQLLDGLDILIEQWQYTHDYLDHGAFRDDMLIRECSHAHEALSITDFYREIAQSIRQQRDEQRSKPNR